jgi:D-beta-D-heptose 7-phosphate kinase / D-beta-D-heptose 1-phosphate adenosyltransferase
VVRVDEGCERPEVPAATAGMLRALDQSEVVIVADYGRGVAANPEIRELLEARAGDIPIVWDPHPSGAVPVRGVAVVTPNLSEAAKAADSSTGTPGATAAVGSALGETLLQRWQSQAVLVTMGEQGGLLSRPDTQPMTIPAPPTEVTDPCGAGDRLAASLAVHLAEGRSIQEAAELAINEAAAFLGVGGVASLPDRHRPVWHHSREEDALGLARRVRANGGTVVATGGCFDLLHAGHARTLAAARELGDCLIVCLNSDESVRRTKGEQRPIVSQQDRAELLLALECVDAVLVFGEDTPEACLETLRPDVWVKGGDYRASELPEAGLIESWGGRCVTVPFHQARSTSVLADALAKVS